MGKSWLCPSCSKAVKSGSIACTGCRLWVHLTKKCAGITPKEGKVMTASKRALFLCPGCNVSAPNVPSEDSITPEETNEECVSTADVLSTDKSSEKCVSTADVLCTDKSSEECVSTADVLCTDESQTATNDVIIDMELVSDAPTTQTQEIASNSIETSVFTSRYDEILEIIAEEILCDGNLPGSASDRDEVLENSPQGPLRIVNTKGKNAIKKRDVISTQAKQPAKKKVKCNSGQTLSVKSKKNEKDPPKKRRPSKKGSSSKVKERQPLKLDDVEVEDSCESDINENNVDNGECDSDCIAELNLLPNKGVKLDCKSKFKPASNNLEEDMQSKDNTKWSTDIHMKKRFQAADVIPLKLKPGLKDTGKVNSPTESFYSFMKVEYIEKAVVYTNEVLRRDRILLKNDKESWLNNKHNYNDTSVEELNAFIGLLMMSSFWNLSLLGCWTNPMAPPHFAATMSYRRFLTLLTKIRFDDYKTRASRRQTDKFAALREIFDDFAENLSRYSNPSESVTVDEMTVAYRGFKCSFVVYNKDKPNPYGIKLWTLADAQNRFVYNLQPYLGKVGEKSEKGLGQRVVLDLIKPVSKTGRNVCADNFFSTKNLGETLMSEHTLTYLGTVKKNHVGVPPYIGSIDRDENDIRYAYQGRTQLMSMIVKKKRNVVIINTGKATENLVDCLTKSGDVKTKPELIYIYNNEKVGVDAIDQLCSYIDIAPRSKRWSITVFCRMLEISLVNAFTLLNMDGNPGTGSMSRTKFTQSIALSLVMPYLMARDTTFLSESLKLKISCAIANAPENLVKQLAPVDSRVNNEKQLPDSAPSTDLRRCFHCYKNQTTLKGKRNLTKVKTFCRMCFKAVCKKHSHVEICCSDCHTGN